LEARPWGEKVDGLLGHFTQLSEAHQSLVRLRRQDELLEPVARAGEAYRACAGRLERAGRLLDAADSFFRHKAVGLFGPLGAARAAELAAAREGRDRLGRELAEAQEEARRLRNEIDQAVAPRLRQIPLLLQGHESQARLKRQASRRYH